MDRLLLDFTLAYDRRDLRAAMDFIRRLVEIAPGSMFLDRAGILALHEMGSPGEAIEFFERADPEGPWLRGFRAGQYWERLTRAYHEVGDYERELEALARWRQLRPEYRTMHRVEFRVLAALGRIDELGDRILAEIQGGRLEHSFWFDELRAHGYPAAASALLDRTLEWFESTPNNLERRLPNSALQYLVYGRLLHRAGRLREAQAVLEELVAGRLMGPLPAWELMSVLARQGHRDEAFKAAAPRSGPDFPRLR